MRLGTTPTTVVCVGTAAETVGSFVAAHIADRRLPCPPQVWAVRETEGGVEASRVHPGTPATERWVGASGEVMARLVAGVLTVGHVATAQAMEESLGLRVSLIAAIDDAAGLAPLSAALDSAARIHTATRHVTEAYIIVPRSAAPEAAGRLRSMLDARALELTWCWWLGHVNARGLSLPDSEIAAGEIAAVIAAALLLPPHRLPLWEGPATDLPIHLGVGYAELHADAAALTTSVVDRHVSQLIGDLLLQGRGRVDRSAIRRRSWAVASTRCQAAIDRIHETPGGERIWKGLRLTIPEEVARGIIRGLLADVDAARVRFESDRHEDGLASCRQKFDRAADMCVQEIAGIIDGELDTLAQLGSGRLFDAVALLEELAAVWSDPADVREGETATNLQDIRRRHDERMTAAVHLKVPSAADSAARAVALKHEYTELEYLRAILQPPGLPADVFRAIEVKSDSIDGRLAVLDRDVEQARRDWAQIVVNVEAETRRGFPAAYEAEKGRRSGAIDTAAGDLRAARDAWEAAVLRLRRFDRVRGGRLLFGHRSRLALESAVTRAHAAMLSAARTLIDAADSWAQLRIDAAVHEARASAIARVLTHVHARHAQLQSTLAELVEWEVRLRAATPPDDSRLLRRPIVASVDLPVLASTFTPSGESPGAALGDRSLLTVALNPADVILGRLRAYSGFIHAPLAACGAETLLRVCQRPAEWLSDAAAWMRAVSAPWVPPSYAETVDSVVVCGCADSPLGGVLRSTFPEAIWLEEADGPAVLVVSIRRYLRGEDAPLPSRSAAPD